MPRVENRREQHRIVRFAITLGKSRLSVWPDLQGLRRQVGAELHLLLDDPLPASFHPEALLELRLHRLAISLGRRIEMADRLQHPRVDKAQEGLVGKIGRASCRERVCQYV